MKSQIYNMNDPDSSTHFNNNPRFETSSLINKDSSFESSFSLPSRIRHPPNVNIEPALENDHQEINTKSQIDAVASQKFTGELGPSYGKDGCGYYIYQKINASGTSNLDRADSWNKRRFRC